MPNGEGASREHLRPADLRPEPLTAAAGSFARCMADGLRPSKFTFQDPGAVDCAAMFADCVRCTMMGKDDACRRVALRQRHAVDPYAMAWPPRPAYVTQLALQRRLPYQVDQERRTGVRVAVPPLGPRSSASAEQSDRRRRGPPPPPSSGVSWRVDAPTHRHLPLQLDSV
jgi:hypothetical protein